MNNTTQMTVKDFIAAHKLTLVNTPTNRNPSMESERGVKMNHWTCSISDGTNQFHTLFSKGDGLRIWAKDQFGKTAPGHKVGEKVSNPLRLTVYESKLREQYTQPEPPELEEVLDCLASDAQSVDNAADFEDWAEEYGYDTDSRKAEQTYQACRKQAKELKQFLGRERFKELLECERL